MQCLGGLAVLFTICSYSDTRLAVRFLVSRERERGMRLLILAECCQRSILRPSFNPSRDEAVSPIHEDHRESAVNSPAPAYHFTSIPSHPSIPPSLFSLLPPTLITYPLLSILSSQPPHPSSQITPSPPPPSPPPQSQPNPHKQHKTNFPPNIPFAHSHKRRERKPKG